MLFEVTVVILILAMLMILIFGFFPDNRIYHAARGRRIYIVKSRSDSRGRTVIIYGAGTGEGETAVNIYLSPSSHTQVLVSHLQTAGNVPEKQNFIDVQV